MKKVKVYEYTQDGVDCTDLVVEDRIYPFLTEVMHGGNLIEDFAPYDFYPLEGNLPDHAVLVHEYEVEG